VIAARAPEVADYTVSFEILQLVIDVVDALEARTAVLSEAASGLPEAARGKDSRAA
jgi:hypothetical protein